MFSDPAEHVSIQKRGQAIMTERESPDEDRTDEMGNKTVQRG